MSTQTLEDALAELDPQVLEAMANVRTALQQRGLTAADSFRKVLERAQQICRDHRNSASPDHARALAELEEGITAAGEVLEQVCLDVAR